MPGCEVLTHRETVQVLALLRLVTPELISTVVPSPLRFNAPSAEVGPPVALIEPVPPLRLSVPFIALPPEPSLITVEPERLLKLYFPIGVGSETEAGALSRSVPPLMVV